jgi:hypothetical protein
MRLVSAMALLRHHMMSDLSPECALCGPQHRRSHGPGNGSFCYFAASVPLALALGKTFPRLSIFALLLLPGDVMIDNVAVAALP